jgi:hypothetical protein
MARRAGSADLPLHGGHVPRWLADRMTRIMSGRICADSESIIRAGSSPYALRSVPCRNLGRRFRSKHRAATI